MASVFKRKLKNGTIGRYWYYTFIDEDGKRRMKRGLTDKRLTEQLAAKVEHQGDKVRTGLVDRAEKQRAEARSVPLSRHVDAFETHQESKGNTSKHNKLTLSRIRAVIEAGEITTLGDFTKEAVVEVLQNLQKEEDIGHRTYNHYVQALDGFGRWLVESDRVLSNPLKGLPRLNSAEDVRHQRRALSARELMALVHSAETCKRKVQGYSGILRARLYRIAYLTGLRRRELGSLTTASFKLDSDPPTLTVEAACSKHRKKDTLPIHPDLLDLLREWLPGLGVNETLFPKLERKKTWRMVQKDLEAAGIPYETEEGIADFHAAGRHSHVSGLVNSGVSLANARQLARHGDVRMTMRYTHVGLEDQAEALRSLPTIEKAPKGKQEPAARGAKEANEVQRNSSAPKPPGEHSVTCAGTKPEPKEGDGKNKKPCGNRGYDATRRSESTVGKTAKKWRRRESNLQMIPS